MRRMTLVPPALISLLMIAGGVLVINVFSKTSGHRDSDSAAFPAFRAGKKAASSILFPPAHYRRYFYAY